MTKRHLLALVVALASIGSSRAANIVYADGFEAATFNSFWTVSQLAGTAIPSTVQAHSGNQSAQFSSVNGVQRGIGLTHIFSSAVQGTVSVYLYDPAPGQETLYMQLGVSSSTNSTSNGNAGIQDFDPTCYMAVSGGVGPNANCGFRQQNSTTNILRTSGWHLLSMTVGPTGFIIAIDGITQVNRSGNFSFDRLDLFMSGPGFRPNATTYFDDFSLNVTEVGSIPEPSTWALLISGLAVGAIARRKKATQVK